MAFEPKHACPALTLIELLVVNTIIAVLATAVVALAPMGRGKAQLAADTRKLRDIGGAMASYASDNNMTLPCQATTISGNNTSESEPPRFNFHEAVDRYSGPVSGFNPKCTPVKMPPSSRIEPPMG
jgi:type II secretory pathway pseudopilin PulG